MEITNDLNNKFKSTFQSDAKKKLAKNAAVKNGINNASFDETVAVKANPEFSVEVKTGKVPNQKSSGRCWLFANLNVLREDFVQSTNLGDKNVELSQTYIYFFDKFEKANYFYENILNTADLPLDSREVAFLLQTPQEDGGQWDMIISLLDKYGIVPQSAMPDNANSEASGQLNNYLNKRLRIDAKILRQLVEEGASEENIDEKREELLENIYNILSISLGTPPETFDFEYRNTDDEFIQRIGITPDEFYKEFITMDMHDYVPVINAPTANKPYNQTYSVDMLGNVVGGQEVKYLNIEMDILKEATIKQLQAGETVWFGCDVGQSSERKQGAMALGIYDVENLFDVNFESNKTDRLEYGESVLTHAMVITGVDLVDGKPTKWKVQNSWGDKVGNKGYFTMTDEWMDEYAYQVVVNKKYLPEEYVSLFETNEPTLLPAWDPMGSLAL